MRALFTVAYKTGQIRYIDGVYIKIETIALIDSLLLGTFAAGMIRIM